MLSQAHPPSNFILSDSDADNSPMSVRVAVVGATGAVGRRMLQTLDARNFPASSVAALASARSRGRKVSLGEARTLTVQSLEDFDFAETDLALFSAGGSVSAAHAPRAAAAGTVVVDNSSYFRMDEDIPLVVPEVNAEALAQVTRRNIVANPNCSTIQLVVALKPLHDIGPIKRVVVSTYQSVSGAGLGAMEELEAQVRGELFNEKAAVARLPRRIAFNVVPQIDVFEDDGSTREEWKMVHETRKILDPDIALAATCVRVPVFIGHAEAVNVEFASPVTPSDATAALMAAAGVDVVDAGDIQMYATPIDCPHEDSVLVSRIRTDPTVDHGLQFWVVADNVGKGAALNAVQIAEHLIRSDLLR